MIDQDGAGEPAETPRRQRAATAAKNACGRSPRHEIRPTLAVAGEANVAAVENSA